MRPFEYESTIDLASSIGLCQYRDALVRGVALHNNNQNSAPGGSEETVGTGYWHLDTIVNADVVRKP